MTCDEACTVLDVLPGCNRQELKRAYQKKIKYWHPDNFVASTEILPEMKEFAAERMRRVIEAFTVLADTDCDCPPEPTEYSDAPRTFSVVCEAPEVHLLVQQIQNLTHRVRGMSEKIQGLSDGLDELTGKAERNTHYMQRMSSKAD